MLKRYDYIPMRLADECLYLDGRSVRVLRGGNGPLVLCLHGFACSADLWRPTLPALIEAGYSALAIDLPGHGASYRPRRAYSVADLTRLVADVLHAVGAECVALIGNSLGGAVASEFALLHPERVTHLVLVDPFGLDPHLPVFQQAHYWTHLIMPVAFEMLAGRRVWSRRRLLRMISCAPEHLPTGVVVLDYPGGWRHNYWGRVLVGLGVFGRMLTRRQRQAFARRRAQLRVPTLIIWGEDDQLLPVEQAYRAHQLIPNARLRVFPHCGHTPNVEWAEAFNREVVGFLGQA